MDYHFLKKRLATSNEWKSELMDPGRRVTLFLITWAFMSVWRNFSPIWILRNLDFGRVMIVGNLYSECLSKEALDGLGDLNIGGQIIQTVKYADDLVLMAKEETVLQGIIDKLI